MLNVISEEKVKVDVGKLEVVKGVVKVLKLVGKVRCTTSVE